MSATTIKRTDKKRTRTSSRRKGKRSKEPAGDLLAKRSPAEERGHQMLHFIRDQVIGMDSPFQGPYGLRRAVYCDYTASGKPVRCIEEYMRQHVMPFYGNTHTTASIVGRQSTSFRQEARQLVKEAVRGQEDDVVLFTGSGATSAIHKLIAARGVDLMNKEDVVVFVGPFEHHSNLLPWRELGVRVVNVPCTPQGLVDLHTLDRQLSAHSGYPMKIGTFSAGSNVTGILTDQNAVSACLHRHGALALWDFAGAGPYIPVDMNPVVEGEDSHLVYKDAVFLSPHKFVGGPGTPGVLVAKRNLFTRAVPKDCGGGTVLFVTRREQKYLQELEEREEGGTPEILGAIRCGLVFQLKQQIGDDFIHQGELDFSRRALEALSSIPNIEVLGSAEVDRIPIISMMFRHGSSGAYLHYNFVCTLLNDVYGIQSRGGCMCAGPYAQTLLRIDDALAQRYRTILANGHEAEVYRPGFVRLNFHYTMDDAMFDFVISALREVTEHGWKLLPQYQFSLTRGLWCHRQWSSTQGLQSLRAIRYEQPDGVMGLGMNDGVDVLPRPATSPEEYYRMCMMESKALYECAEAVAEEIVVDDEPVSLQEGESHALRWFLLPSEAQACLAGEQIPSLPILDRVVVDEESAVEYECPAPCQMNKPRLRVPFMRSALRVLRRRVPSNV